MFKDKSTHGVDSGGGNTQNQLSTMTPNSDVYLFNSGGTIGKPKLPKRRSTDQVIRSTGGVFEEFNEQKSYIKEPFKNFKDTEYEDLLDDDMDTATGLSDRLQSKPKISVSVSSRGGLMPINFTTTTSLPLQGNTMSIHSPTNTILIHNYDQNKVNLNPQANGDYGVRSDLNMGEDCAYNISDIDEPTIQKPLSSRLNMGKLNLQTFNISSPEQNKAKLTRSFTPMFNDFALSQKRRN